MALGHLVDQGSGFAGAVDLVADDFGRADAVPVVQLLEHRGQGDGVRHRAGHDFGLGDEAGTGQQTGVVLQFGHPFAVVAVGALLAVGRSTRRWPPGWVGSGVTTVSSAMTLARAASHKRRSLSWLGLRKGGSDSEASRWSCKSSAAPPTRCSRSARS